MTITKVPLHRYSRALFFFVMPGLYSFFVMAGLAPAIHVFLFIKNNTWMPGPPPEVAALI